MGSYAENEQDAREFAELQRQFAEEKLDAEIREEVLRFPPGSRRAIAEENEFWKQAYKNKKTEVTMDEIVEHRRQQRNEENAGRHMDAQETWAEWVEKNGDDFEREPQQENLIREIEQVVSLNIGYGSPPYSLESAEEILLDILNDLTSMKERLEL